MTFSFKLKGRNLSNKLNMLLKKSQMGECRPDYGRVELGSPKKQLQLKLNPQSPDLKSGTLITRPRNLRVFYRFFTVLVWQMLSKQWNLYNWFKVATMSFSLFSFRRGWYHCAVCNLGTRWHWSWPTKRPAKARFKACSVRPSNRVLPLGCTIIESAKDVQEVRYYTPTILFWSTLPHSPSPKGP